MLLVSSSNLFSLWDSYQGKKIKVKIKHKTIPVNENGTKKEQVRVEPNKSKLTPNTLVVGDAQAAVGNRGMDARMRMCSWSSLDARCGCCEGWCCVVSVAVWGWLTQRRWWGAALRSVRGAVFCCETTPPLHTHTAAGTRASRTQRATQSRQHCCQNSQIILILIHERWFGDFGSPSACHNVHISKTDLV